MRIIATALGLLALSSSACANENNNGGKHVRGAELNRAIADEKFKKITSVLVSVDGTLVSEQYWGDANASYLHDTRSTTKSLTAMLVGAAISDGYIGGTDETIFSRFEKERPYRFSSAGKDAITIRDLLSMSSALDCNDNEWQSPGNEEHMYPARKWTYFVTDMPTKDDYERGESGFGPFSYCTAGSFFLGQIVERATGESLEKYAQRRIFEPLGITKVKWDRSPSGETMTGGGTELTSRGLMKLAEVARNRGRHGDHQILPKKWADEMLTAHVTANERQDYGYQWWQSEFACGDKSVSGWYMGGNGGNKVAIFKDLKLSVVVTAQLYSTRGMHQQSTDIIEDFVLPTFPQCQ